MKLDKKNNSKTRDNILCNKLILMYKTKEIRTNNELISVIIKGFRFFKQVVRLGIEKIQLGG